MWVAESAVGRITIEFLENQIPVFVEIYRGHTGLSNRLAPTWQAKVCFEPAELFRSKPRTSRKLFPSKRGSITGLS